MRLIDADELKKYAIPCEIHNGALTNLYVPLYQINSALTVETSKIEYKAYNEGFKDGVEQGIKLSDRPQGKWYDYVEDSLLKARHGKHVLYDVDFLLDHLAHEVSIMEQVRQMRDKEI